MILHLKVGSPKLKKAYLLTNVWWYLGHAKSFSNIYLYYLFHTASASQDIYNILIINPQGSL